MIEYFEAKRQSDSDVVQIDQLLAMQRKDLNQAVGALIGQICESIESRSVGESEHVNRVRKMTRALTKEFALQHPEFGLKDDIIDAIANASVLHDVGKIFVREEILAKAGNLPPEEMAEIQVAPTYGAKLLNRVQGIPEPFYTFAKEICRSHMERWDGKGYPDGLKENQIPISAQLASLAEAYDVLVSKRVYKKAYSHDEAMKMIKDGECGAFNPDLLDCLDGAADEFKKISAGIE